MYLSIIAPVFNEEKNIDFLINEISQAFKNEILDYEIILINDGSKDKSKERIIKNQNKFSNLKLVNNDKNLGIFKSWNEGIKNASGELICLIDSDLQINPSYILKLLQIYEKNDCHFVKGNRVSLENKLDLRFYYSRVLNYLLNLIFRIDSADSKSGFVLGEREAFIEVLKLKLNYSYAQTFIYIAAIFKGFKTIETDILFEKRKNNNSFISQFPFLLICNVLLDLIKSFFEFYFLTKKKSDLERFAEKKFNNTYVEKKNLLEIIYWKFYTFISVLHKWNISKKFYRYYEALKKTQYLSNKELKEYQLYKLKKILRHAYGNSPYYTEQFNQKKFHIRNFKSLEDLNKIPYLEKSVLKKNSKLNIFAHNVDLFKIYKITTSGSTGEPMKIYVDNEQLEIRFASTLRGQEWAGWKIGTKNIRLWHQTIGMNYLQILKERFDAFLMRRIFFPAYNFDDNLVKKLFRIIAKNENIIIDGYAESLNYLNKLSKDNSLKLKSIISSAQILPKYIKKEIEQKFNTTVYDKYGSREFSGIAYENNEKNGHLIQMESYIVEIIKDNKKAKPGEIGEIVITDLNNLIMPMIRYRIGDLAEAISVDYNSCKIKMDRIGDIYGRTQSIVILPNTKWLPATFFIHIFKDFEDYITQFQIIQKKIDLIIINIIKTELYNDTVEKKIMILLRDFIEDSVEISIIVVEKIKNIKTGKVNYIINEMSEDFQKLKGMSHE
jgi:phenylacetate-CoA ligase